MTGRRGPAAARVLLGVAAVALLGVLLAAGLIHRGAPSGSDPLLPVTQHRDEPAPPLTGPTLAGGRFDLAALRGQVVVVNVMASWCAPCRQKLPMLATAAAQWATSGVRVVGVAMRDDAGDTAKLLNDTGATALTVVADHRIAAMPLGTSKRCISR